MPRPRRLAALPLGGSRRVTTEVDSSIIATGFCCLAAPKRGERPHQRQSEPDFSLRLLVSQLSSSPAFLCKPLEHTRHVHREKPVSMEARRGVRFASACAIAHQKQKRPDAQK